jgi:hypothetical protein
VTLHVSPSDGAAATSREALAFLSIRPVEHNLILALLFQRADSGEGGRYDFTGALHT